MARVIRCDRCGRIFEEELDDVKFVYCSFKYDFCRRCHKDLEAFIRNEDVSRQYVLGKENNND